MIKVTLTDTNARRVVEALKHSTDGSAKALVAQLKAHLGAQPVKCHHCKVTFAGGAGELAYADHLATVHHYETNDEVEARGDKPEDTAENTAWAAFHSC